MTEKSRACDTPDFGPVAQNDAYLSDAFAELDETLLVASSAIEDEMVAEKKQVGTNVSMPPCSAQNNDSEWIEGYHAFHAESSSNDSYFTPDTCSQEASSDDCRLTGSKRSSDESQLSDNCVPSRHDAKKSRKRHKSHQKEPDAEPVAVLDASGPRVTAKSDNREPIPPFVPIGFQAYDDNPTHESISTLNRDGSVADEDVQMGKVAKFFAAVTDAGGATEFVPAAMPGFAARRAEEERMLRRDGYDPGDIHRIKARCEICKWEVTDFLTKAAAEGVHVFSATYRDRILTGDIQQAWDYLANIWNTLVVAKHCAAMKEEASRNELVRTAMKSLNTNKNSDNDVIGTGNVSLVSESSGYSSTSGLSDDVRNKLGGRFPTRLYRSSGPSGGSSDINSNSINSSSSTGSGSEYGSNSEFGNRISSPSKKHSKDSAIPITASPRSDLHDASFDSSSMYSGSETSASTAASIASSSQNSPFAANRRRPRHQRHYQQSKRARPGMPRIPEFMTPSIPQGKELTYDIPDVPRCITGSDVLIHIKYCDPCPMYNLSQVRSTLVEMLTILGNGGVAGHKLIGGRRTGQYSINEDGIKMYLVIEKRLENVNMQIAAIRSMAGITNGTSHAMQPAMIRPVRPGNAMTLLRLQTISSQVKDRSLETQKYIAGLSIS